ncbi:ABC transporter ATP-binding protein [Sporomusa termitida]|uniref:Multidrug export ATP-binding/permease protein n=1 Tax=Sporomusa termitida TaxID=2377 RepID=A0A517DWU5_9FIRM|nr:ABC transporter ATP-binding protein [Sporomusa termitida]QDR81726.1 Putative multidrug export ATP-binding/permease protein [Sporomusa termitida]
MEENNWLKTVWLFAGGCRLQLLLAILCAIVSVAGSMVPYLGVYQIIILFLEEQATVRAVLFWAALSLGGHLIQLGFYALSTMLAHFSAYSILENMRLRIADRLLQAPLGTVLNQTAGKMKSVIVDKVESVEVPLAHLIPEGTANLLLPLAIFAYLLAIDWRMALAATLTIPAAAVIYAVLLQAFDRKYAEYMAAGNYVNSVIVEYIEGIEVIKAFNQSAASYERYERAVGQFREYTLAWFRSTWKVMNLGGAVLPSTLLGAMPAGMYLYLNGTLQPAELTMCLILSLGLVAPLTSFTVFVNDDKAIEYAVKDAADFLNLPGLPVAAAPVELAAYDIALDQVSFAYDAAAPGTAGGRRVLDGLTLRLPQGTFTALVGPSGSGKSTVARLIARFWDVGNGAVRIGGVNIKDLPLSQLADTVSFVTQDNFLFNCSLRENIRLGNPRASDEEVMAAARAACCDGFIRRLAKGYDTGAGEAGSRLSGGEKQRIAIARAILKNAPVVILDEATAFTDPENEDKLQQSLAALTRDKTLLVIAHRLSTIIRAGQIVVMEQGRIVQTGTHAALLAGCPLYRSMWAAHTGARQWAANHEQGDNSPCCKQ